jgi:hypothetical protein
MAQVWDPRLIRERRDLLFKLSCPSNELYDPSHICQFNAGRDTGWCLRITEADSFAVWLTLGNTHRARRPPPPPPIEKWAVAFLAGLPMGFAWYIRVWAPVGPPEGQRSDISTPHAHGMRLWAGPGVLWLGAAYRERRGLVPRQQ